MVYEDIGWIHCTEEDCDAKIKNHYWGKVKSDWFFMKNGNSYCPLHIPDWAKRRKKRDT